MNAKEIVKTSLVEFLGTFAIVYFGSLNYHNETLPELE